MTMQNRKIKILQLCAVDLTVKVLLKALIDGLTDEGFEVVSCCSPGKNSEELKAQGYLIENIEIARSIGLISNLKSIFKLTRFISRGKFDIVHVHTPVAAVLGRIAAKLAGVPLVIYTAHGFYFHERMSKPVYRMVLSIEKLMGRLFTDYIFTQSEEDRLTAVREGIISKERIQAIGNGVDLSRFDTEKINREAVSQKKVQLGIGDNDRVVMFVGRMVKEKGIVELLEAFKALNLQNAKLLLVGGLPETERDIKTFELITRSVKLYCRSLFVTFCFCIKPCSENFLI